MGKIEKRRAPQKPARAKDTKRTPQAESTTAPRFSGAKRIAINAFLIFHIVTITSWCFPFANPLAAACKNAVRPYFLWTGLFQTWDPFSPSPKAINSYVEAIILYKDGNTRTWTFPRMERLSLSERYVKERYRKYVENLKEDSNAALWPDAARYVARLNQSPRSPENMIFLVRYWSRIVPREDESYTPAPWDEHVFYSYTVKPEDLK